MVKTELIHLQSVTYWNGSGSLLRHSFLDILDSATRVSIGDIWWLRDNSIGDCVRGNQLALATIPLGKNLRRWSTSQDAGMDQSCETDVWNVPR